VNGTVQEVLMSSDLHEFIAKLLKKGDMDKTKIQKVLGQL
jgi:hypothetical protein